VAGVLALSPALAVGFLHDDLLQRLSLEGAVPGYEPGPLRLYDFTWGGAPQVAQFIADGKLPWFADPGLALRFFRPLASLTLALDAWCFGRSAPAAHAHSLAWFALLVATVSALYRRWLGPRAARAAALAYALAGGHAMAVGWLSARHGLVGAALAALALLAHARRRDDGWRPGAWLAPLALAAALLASEVALGAVAIWALDEAVGRPGPRRERLRAALPALAVAGAHLAAYALGRYGARHSAAYVSPFDDPAGFVAAAAVRVPVMLAEVYAALPSMLPTAFEPLAAPFAAVGLLAPLGAALALRALGDGAGAPAERRRLLALGLASAAALLPAGGAIVGGRVLPVAGIGGAAVLGALLVGAYDRARARRGPARLGWGALAAAVAALHFGLAPLGGAGLLLMFRKNAEDERAYAERAETAACPAGRVGYVVNGSDPVNSLYAAPALLFYRPERVAHLAGLRVLSLAPNGMRLRGLGGGAFELETLGPRRHTVFERVYRDAPLAPGDGARAGELGARVVAAEGGLPTRVEFRVEGGLDRACFLVWGGGRLARVPAPEAGAVLEVPFEPGPIGQ
jgi:hypothetical protein